MENPNPTKKRARRSGTVIRKRRNGEGEKKRGGKKAYTWRRVDMILPFLHIRATCIRLAFFALIYSRKSEKNIYEKRGGGRPRKEV